MLSAEKIQENWKKHGKIIKTSLNPERVEKVSQMYADFGEEVVLAPASSKESFHNAFPGGYIDHVNRVVECTYALAKTWKKAGIELDFTDEELFFSALFHDLGKLGKKDLPNFLPQTNDWRKKNLQENYTQNPDLDFMLIQDRSIFILQSYSIQISQKEFLAIKIHDGLYDETNKPYLISYNPDARLKTNLPLILHQGDLLATKIEQQRHSTK